MKVSTRSRRLCRWTCAVGLLLPCLYVISGMARSKQVVLGFAHAVLTAQYIHMLLSLNDAVALPTLLALCLVGSVVCLVIALSQQCELALICSGQQQPTSRIASQTITFRHLCKLVDVENDLSNQTIFFQGGPATFYLFTHRT